MKIIKQNTPDFIVDLGEANTGDYALEDFLILFDETCNSITLPAQVKIKGNPNIYLQCISTSAFKFKLKLSGGDYMPVNTFISPDGKSSEATIDINQNISNVSLFYAKPLAGGAWISAGN